MKSNAHAGLARVARALGLFLSAMLLSCGKCPPDPAPPPQPPPALWTLRVLPAEVRIGVPAGATQVSYRLEAVAFNEYENPVDGEVRWSTPASGVSLDEDGNAVVVTVSAPLPLETEVTVTATLGLLSATSNAVLAEPKATDDVVTADEVASENPSVVLASGDESSGCSMDGMRAFIVSAPVGPFVGSTACTRSEAAVFTVARQPYIVRPQVWTSGADPVDAAGKPGPVEIPLLIVIGVKTTVADAADTFMNNSLLNASESLRSMRAGVALPPGKQKKVRLELSAAIDDCIDIPTLPASVAPDNERLNFYVVEHVVNDARGVFCAPNVMLISRTAAVASSPLHELSHALGLVAQDFGHVDQVDGFMRDNVMSTETGAGSGADLRYRLTLGQVYRMHRDGRSWLLRNGTSYEKAFRCECDPYAKSSCPMLSADMRPPAGAGLVPFPTDKCS